MTAFICLNVRNENGPEKKFFCFTLVRLILVNMLGVQCNLFILMHCKSNGSFTLEMPDTDLDNLGCSLKNTCLGG